MGQICRLQSALQPVIHLMFQIELAKYSKIKMNWIFHSACLCESGHVLPIQGYTDEGIWNGVGKVYRPSKVPACKLICKLPGQICVCNCESAPLTTARLPRRPHTTARIKYAQLCPCTIYTKFFEKQSSKISLIADPEGHRLEKMEGSLTADSNPQFYGGANDLNMPLQSSHLPFTRLPIRPAVDWKVSHQIGFE